MSPFQEMMPSGPRSNDTDLFSEKNIAENKKNNYENARRLKAAEHHLVPEMVNQHSDGKWYYGKGDEYDILLEEFDDLYKKEKGERY